MAVFKLLQSHLTLSTLFLITFHLFLIIPSATPLTFNFPSISDDQNGDIVLSNPAVSDFSSSEGLQLTPNGYDKNRNHSAGRASYIKPLHLWHNATGEMADFSTNFTFVIDSRRSYDYGDGLAFFLARNNSVITRGGAMGLPIDPTTNNATDPFVAVEFDTYWNNSWDPYNSSVSIGDHVGIDISSIISVEFRRWFSNIPNGAENEAWISYNAASQNLSVVFTGFQNNERINQSGLHHIVDLRRELPEWVIFGFSAATGDSFQLNRIRSWSFNSSILQADVPAEPPAEPPVPQGGGNYTGIGGNEGNRTGFVVGLSVGLSALVIGLVLVGFGLWNKRRGGRKEEDLEFDESMDNEFEMGTGPKKFSYYELVRDTNNFAEEEKLGEGGFGGVYRGFSKELNSYVAVKRVSKSSKQGIKEYASEVKIISRLRHRNLVQLIGWCHQKGELLLVYEFMENGSLDFHLFKGKSLLTWGVRLKVSQGLASALLYLHEEWEQCVVHRDIKSSNIMLDSNFNAKLGDFGLARLVDHEKGSQTTVVAGTMGYMAPEYVVTGKASKESDVFSFGVVALEIACGRKPIELKAQESEMRMVEWVWNLYGMAKLLEAADPKLCGDFNVQEMERLMIVGLWCAHPDSKLRPSIRQAIHVLNVEASLPILPSKMPVATYFAPPTSSFSSSYG